MKTLNERHKNIFKFIYQILIISVASLVSGIVFRTFFVPNEIIPAGLSGFALIISNLFYSGGINIPTALIYLAINLIVFSFAFKAFGWKVLLLSLIGMGSYTLGMEFGYVEALIGSGDVLLYSIVGGLITGLCIGIALRFGGSTGGSDITGSLLNHYFPKIKTGYFILMINIIVILLSIITAGLQTGLYALVVAIISSMSTNLVLDSSKRVVAYYIICEREEEIAHSILNRFHRGVTKLESIGMFSKKEKALLLCLVPSEQANEMKKLVEKIDENAFVFSAPVTETLGDGKFMKEASIFKNKIKNSVPLIKTKTKYNRHEKIKKLKLKKKQKKFKIN